MFDFEGMETFFKLIPIVLGMLVGLVIGAAAYIVYLTNLLEQGANCAV